MASTSEMLFNYLHDIIYHPNDAALDIESLDDEYKHLGQGLVFLNTMIIENNNFVIALARGDLSMSPPSKENLLASPYKSLHASLKHLTWQTKQVAEGDYQQKVDFMGEFTEAFNKMITQLDSRQRALEDEIRRGKEKSIALEQSNVLLMSISETISQGIIVISESSGNILFSNNSMEHIIKSHDNLSDILISNYINSVSDDMEISIMSDEQLKYYSLRIFPIKWGNEDAKVFVLDDISAEIEKRIELERYAMQDELTGMNNRYAGMKILYQWFDDKKRFVLCFVDLDNLKYVNDVFGHAEGDNYIITVAKHMTTIFPETIVCRIGGDEFMVLIPNIEKGEVEELLHNSRTELINLCKASNLGYEMIFSYGAVQHDEGENTSELLSIADDRMYVFKRENKKRYNK